MQHKWSIFKKGTKEIYLGDDRFFHNATASLLLTALISVDKYGCGRLNNDGKLRKSEDNVRIREPTLIVLHALNVDYWCIAEILMGKANIDEISIGARYKINGGFFKKGMKETYVGDYLFFPQRNGLAASDGININRKYNIVKIKTLSSIFGIKLEPRTNGF